MQQKTLAQTNIRPNINTNNVQRYKKATSACSQKGVRCGPSGQKDLCNTTAIQFEEAREFICSTGIIRKEKSGRKFST